MKMAYIRISDGAHENINFNGISLVFCACYLLKIQNICAMMLCGNIQFAHKVEVVKLEFPYPPKNTHHCPCSDNVLVLQLGFNLTLIVCE